MVVFGSGRGVHGDGWEDEKPEVRARSVRLNDDNRALIAGRFMAFDVETTGLYPDSDRIVELGAVLFEDGVATETFSSLLNPHVPIAPEASRVNHITNAMLIASPPEEEVFASFTAFLGDALEGAVPFVAHNARFDMGFLTATLERLGYAADLAYLDTLALSRAYVRGVPNYRQPTLAAHFGIVNETEHRAATDAKTCGLILLKLIELQQRRG